MENPPKDKTSIFLSKHAWFVGAGSLMCLFGSEIGYRNTPQAGELRLGFLILAGIAVLMVVLARISQSSADARFFSEMAAKNTERRDSERSG